MKDIIVNPNISRATAASVALRFQTRPGGDVEIVNSGGGDDSFLGLIPKDKRAALAKFLLETE